MKFLSPTKWLILKMEAVGFQFGLGTLRDAEPSNVESGAPRNVIQRAVCRMLGEGENESSALVPA